MVPANLAKRNLIRILVIGLVVSIFAFAIVALSPGNTERQGHFSTSDPIVSLLKAATYTIFLIGRPFIEVLDRPLISIVSQMYPTVLPDLERALQRISPPSVTIISLMLPAVFAFLYPPTQTQC